MRLKSQKFTRAAEKVEERQKNDLLPPLTLKQQKMKKQIQRRHSEAHPTLIGCSSPRDIEKMINRKLARVKTEPEEVDPIIEIFVSKSEKKRSYEHGAFKPIVLV